MSTEIALSPECLDIANAYIQYGTAQEAAHQLGLPEYQVLKFLERKDVTDYINGIYLDRGYRNRARIGQILDKMIDSKLEEAEETGMYTKKDLHDLLILAQKIRVEEAKIMGLGNDPQAAGPTVNIANFGNYGQLMERLIEHKK